MLRPSLEQAPKYGKSVLLECFTAGLLVENVLSFIKLKHKSQFINCTKELFTQVPIINCNTLLVVNSTD